MLLLLLTLLSAPADAGDYAPIEVGALFVDGEADLTNVDGARSWNRLYGQTQDVVVTLRAQLGVRVTKDVGLFAGPALQLLVPADERPQRVPRGEQLGSIELAGRRLPLWLGLSFGVRFR